MSIRPEWVTVNGGKISILAHDEYYRATKRAWRQKLAKVHPDRRLARTAKGRQPSKSGRIGTRDSRSYETKTCACGNRMTRGATTCQSCRIIRESRSRGTKICACGNVMARGADTCQSCWFHKRLPAGRFLTAHEQYQKWREQEAQWYAQFDLLPPDQIRGSNQMNARLLAERYA